MPEWVNQLSLDEEKPLGSNYKTTQISVHFENRAMSMVNKKSCISVITCKYPKQEKRQTKALEKVLAWDLQAWGPGLGKAERATLVFP